MVSVVMSIYKEPVEWMKLSIDSILNQTFTDFKFIIVNDNPDRVENKHLLDYYSHEDSRIIVITNELNMGLTKSLNKALLIAEGEYIVRMDADDISMPQRLEKQVKFMNKHKELIASGTYAKIIDENGNITNKEKLSTDPVTLKSLLLFSSPMFHPSVIFRSFVDGKRVLYDETMRYAQDYALWIELFDKHLIGNIPEYLIQYRFSNSQISTKHIEEQRACAKRNRQRVMDSLNIELSQKDSDILTGVLDGKLLYEDEEVVHCLSNIQNAVAQNKILKINHINEFMILMYCNYISKTSTFIQAICKLIRISFNLKSFSIFSYLYLSKSYLCK